MISVIFSILSFIVVVYTLFCLINIIMTWIPGSKYTKFGKFVTKITEPYLSFFSKRGWLRFGNLDFSPILSLAILSFLSSIFGRLAAAGKITLGGILASLISLLWSIASTFLIIFFVVILVRWIVLLSKNGETDYNSVWNQVDSIIGNFCRKVAGTIVRKPVKYQTSLLITWITTLVVYIVSAELINILESLFLKIPF